MGPKGRPIVVETFISKQSTRLSGRAMKKLKSIPVNHQQGLWQLKKPRGEGQGGVEEKEASEEPEGPGEQVRSDKPSNAAGPSGSEARGRWGSGSRGRGGIGSGDRREVYQSMRVAELQQELKSRKLHQTGKKDELISRQK